MRIISIERLQILRLTLQNIALHVQRRERELQMQTVRRMLLHHGKRTSQGREETPAGAAKMSHATPSTLEEKTLRVATVLEVLEAASVSYGGGEELLELARGGTPNPPVSTMTVDDHEGDESGSQARLAPTRTVSLA